MSFTLNVAFFNSCALSRNANFHYAESNIVQCWHNDAQDEENQHSNTEHSSPQNHKCRDADCAAITTVPFMLNVINAVMLSVFFLFLLSVVLHCVAMLSLVMLSVLC
jgi:hypothetical protein